MKRSLKLGVVSALFCLVAGAFLAISASSSKSLSNSPIKNEAPQPSDLIFNRELKSSTISYGNTAVNISPGFVNIDSPLNFTCPGPGTCTISAEQNVQVGGTTTGNGVAICGLVDGNFMVQPKCPYIAYAPSDGFYLGVSFSQSTSSLSPGQHTIQTQLKTDNGGTLGIYSIIYRLYKP